MSIVLTGAEPSFNSVLAEFGVSSDVLKTIDFGVRSALEPALLRLHQQASTGEQRSERERAEFEQALFDTRQQLAEIGDQLVDTTRVNGELRDQLRVVESDASRRASRLLEVETAHVQCEATISNQSKSLQNTQDERDRLQRLLAERNEDVTAAQQKAEQLQSDLRQSILQNGELKTKLEDRSSEETETTYRNQKWQREREMMAKEKQWYVDELSKRSDQLLEARRELSNARLDHSAAMQNKLNELRDYIDKVEELTAENENLKSQLTKNVERIKEACENRAKAQEGFEKEIQCLKELSQVYKQSANEAENKVEEMTKALETMHQLLSEAKDKHFGMQQDLKTAAEEASTTISERESRIEDLQGELSKANELLQSQNRIKLSDEELVALSPSAAAASKLMKGGMTLSRIYSEHCRVVEECEQLKHEKAQLERYFQDLVSNIELQAPVYARQRRENESLQATAKRFESQLRDVDVQRQGLVTEHDAALRQLKHAKADLERCQRDNADMSSQVRQLLKCIEHSRLGLAEHNPETDESLVLFRNVDELQTKNGQLLSALHDAETRRDEMIEAAKNEEHSSLRDALSQATEEVESLRSFHERQNHVIETLTQQRDNFKNMLLDRTATRERTSRLLLSSSASKDQTQDDSSSVISLDNSSTAEEASSTIGAEFDVYRKEKQKTEQMLNEKLEKLQADLTKLQRTNMKLQTDMQYQEDRNKLQESNREAHLKEAKQLRERNDKLTLTIAKQEEKIRLVTEQLLTVQGEATKFRIEGESLHRQVGDLRVAEQKLRVENEFLRQNNDQHAKLIDNLQHLSSRLEHADTTESINVRSKLEALTSERDELHRTVRQLTQQQNEYVTQLNEKLAATETREAEMTAEVRKLELQLERAMEECGIHTRRLQTLEEESALAKGADATVDESSAKQLTKKLAQAEAQLEESKREEQKLRDQVVALSSQREQYQSLAQTSERSMLATEVTKASQITELTATLEELETHLTQLDKENKVLKEEKAAMQDELNVRMSADAEKDSSVQAKIKSLEAELENVRMELNNWQDRERAAREDVLREQEELHEAHAKLDVEASRIASLEQKLQAERQRAENFENGTAAFQSTIDQLTGEARTKESELAKVNGEYERAKKRLEDDVEGLQEQNNLLLSQIEQLTARVAMFERLQAQQKTGVSDNTTEEAVASEAAVASAESTAEVVRYLREEKRRAETKAATLEEENERSQSKANLLNDELEKTRSQLADALKNSEIVAALTAEKAHLLEQINLLHAMEETVSVLTNENVQLKNSVEANATMMEQVQQNLSGEREVRLMKEGEVEQLSAQLEEQTHNASSWHSRYNELVEQRAQFDSEQVQEFRNQVFVIESERDTLKKEVEELKTAVQAAKDETSSVHASAKSMEEEVESYKTKLDTLAKEMENDKRLLDGARKLARKYRTEATQKEQELAPLKERVDVLEKLKVASEATAEGDVASAPPTNEEVEKLKNEIAELNGKREEDQTEIEGLKAKVEALKSMKPAAGAGGDTGYNVNEAQLLRVKLKKTSQQCLELTNQLTETKDALTETKEALAKSQTDLEGGKMRVNENEARIASLEGLNEKYQKKCGEQRKMINELDTRYADLNQKYLHALQQRTARASPASRPSVKVPPKQQTPPPQPLPSATQRPLQSVRPMQVAAAPAVSVSPTSVPTADLQIPGEAQAIISQPQQSVSLFPTAVVAPHVESSSDVAPMGLGEVSNMSDGSNGGQMAISSSTNARMSVAGSSTGNVRLVYPGEQASSSSDMTRKRTISPSQPGASYASTSKRVCPPPSPCSSDSVSTSTLPSAYPPVHHVAPTLGIVESSTQPAELEAAIIDPLESDAYVIDVGRDADVVDVDDDDEQLQGVDQQEIQQDHEDARELQDVDEGMADSAGESSEEADSTEEDDDIVEIADDDDDDEQEEDQGLMMVEMDDEREAAAVGQEGGEEMEDALDVSQQQPAVSQQNPVRIRRPIVWDEPADSAEDPASTTADTSTGRPLAARQTARRARGPFARRRNL